MPLIFGFFKKYRIILNIGLTLMRLAISASSGVIQVHEVIGDKQIKK